MKVYTAPEELGRAAIRYFAQAVGDHNPLYTDDEYARAHGYDGVIAPPTLIFETNQYTGLPRDEDGYAGHTWDLKTNVRGGNAYTFHQPVRPSDIITATWRIAGIEEKAGMTIVTSTADYTNQHGDRLGANEETLIHIKAPKPPRQTTAEDLEGLEPLERTIELPDMIAYAGATWDWHRLHYEGDPVVDGQLFGALMAEQLQDEGARLRSLRFRLTSAVHAGETVRCTARMVSDTDVEQQVTAAGRLVARGTAVIVP
ncbi:MaoC family dehydratase N-terminal domain-containing protein [Nonomuraea sp. NPDC050556]|uniref:FAS1-like dehydratase domain-containing protein n=1 Tax=Nonomuraea sp. NPDC050556 TaxID=3364369 RepID=UPI00379FA79C